MIPSVSLLLLLPQLIPLRKEEEVKPPPPLFPHRKSVKKIKNLGRRSLRQYPISLSGKREKRKESSVGVYIITGFKAGERRERERERGWKWFFFLGGVCGRRIDPCSTYPFSHKEKKGILFYPLPGAGKGDCLVWLFGRRRRGCEVEEEVLQILWERYYMLGGQGERKGYRSGIHGHRHGNHTKGRDSKTYSECRICA